MMASPALHFVSSENTCFPKRPKLGSETAVKVEELANRLAQPQRWCWSRLPYRVLDLSSRLRASEHVFVHLPNNCKAVINFYVFHCKLEGMLIICFYFCFLLQLLIWTSRMSYLKCFGFFLSSSSHTSSKS